MKTWMFYNDFGLGQGLRMDTTYPKSEPVLGGQVIEFSDAQPKGSIRILVNQDKSTCRSLRLSDKPIGINQLDRIIIDLSVLGGFESQV